MAAGSTYFPIATTTLGSAQSSVSFSSFAGYTDLVVIFNGGENGTNKDFQLKVGNGSIDTGSNYSYTRLIGDGSSASSNRASSTTYIENVIGNEMCTAIYQFQNYANTTTYKTILSRTAYATSRTSVYVGLWRSTSAITTISFTAESGFTINSGSTFTLYGISAA
jgi:hypothetical protein